MEQACRKLKPAIKGGRGGFWCGVWNALAHFEDGDLRHVFAIGFFLLCVNIKQKYEMKETYNKMCKATVLYGFP